MTMSASSCPFPFRRLRQRAAEFADGALRLGGAQEHHRGWAALPARRATRTQPSAWAGGATVGAAEKCLPADQRRLSHFGRATPRSSRALRRADDVPSAGAAATHRTAVGSRHGSPHRSPRSGCNTRLHPYTKDGWYKHCECCGYKWCNKTFNTPRTFK